MRLAHVRRLALGLLLTAPALTAQAPTAQPYPVKQIISISPISLVFGILGGEYERKLSNTTSFGVSGSLYNSSVYNYLSAEGKFRYYPNEKALQGFSIGGTAGLTRVGVDEEFDGSAGNAGNALSVGATLDYQWLLGQQKRFAVTLGGGARRLVFLGTEVDGASLTLPTLRISVGWGF